MVDTAGWFTCWMDQSGSRDKQAKGKPGAAAHSILYAKNVIPLFLPERLGWEWCAMPVEANQQSLNQWTRVY